MAEAYLVELIRTAAGRRGGSLSEWHPADLGGEVINALLERSGVDPEAVEDVVVGCVTQAGEQSFAFGRNCVLASSLPQSVPAVTIDRQCGSSQQALHFAAQAVMSGTQDLIIAMGVESMTRVPMLSNMTLHQEAGLGVGPFSERIRNRFGVKSFSQFHGAEQLARNYNLSREELDEYSLSSHLRAAAATEAGAFRKEILPIATEHGVHDRDEGIRFDASLEAISQVNPLKEGGVITAANASQISDGAAGILVASEAALTRHGLKPKARVVALTITAGDPVLMLGEPIEATRRALQRAGLQSQDIDRYEVNEAFASVPLAWNREMRIDPDRLNVSGGAIALGHPLGASGARIMTTLVHQLRAQGQRYGLQTMCEGGGMANATIIEAL
jgi:acetyl-CoA C-acetyltransferase